MRRRRPTPSGDTPPGDLEWSEAGGLPESGITGIPAVDNAAIRDLLSRVPSGMEPGVWDQAVLGDRLRWLMGAGHLVVMRPEDRALIGTLPRWLLYGPQHGLPLDWFSPTGMLLPRYRPGGGSHDDFRRSRRRYRVISRVLGSFEERVRVFRRERGALIYLAWAMLVFLVGSYLVAEPYRPGSLRENELSSALDTLGILAFAWVGLGVTHLGVRLYARCMARGLAKRLEGGDDRPSS